MHHTKWVSSSPRHIFTFHQIVFIVVALTARGQVLRQHKSPIVVVFWTAAARAQHENKKSSIHCCLLLGRHDRQRWGFAKLNNTLNTNTTAFSRSPWFHCCNPPTTVAAAPNKLRSLTIQSAALAHTGKCTSGNPCWPIPHFRHPSAPRRSIVRA